MNASVKKMATLEQREDGFYVHIVEFSDTTMASGRTRRRAGPRKDFGPYSSREEADDARRKFIDHGEIPSL